MKMPYSGVRPLTINFSDNSTGDVVEWFWDFGLEATSIEQNPTHIYKKPGVFCVTMHVTNNFGETDTLTKIDYIVIDVPQILTGKK